MNNLPPLRCEANSTDDLIIAENIYEDLLLIREKCFERAEDFLQEARRIITVIKNDVRPWDSSQNFYERTPASFAFLNQKIDELYLKESQELQLLFEKEIWQDLDYAKEKEIKSTLRDLFKCEMGIDRISQSNGNGYSPNLSLQLEVLFDDCELLDRLLLVISTNQLADLCADNQPLRLKTLCFISPFLKLFYGGNGDIMDFCKDHQDFLKKSEAMEEVEKDIKTLLSQYTDLSKREIFKLCEEIKSTNEDRRRLRQIVTKEKHRFKEEKGYYEFLGNLSLLLYLWKQEGAGSEVLVSLLKIGMVCYPFYWDGWKNIKTGFASHICEYYWRFNNLNLKDEINLPIKLMKHILDEVNKRDLNEEYLQLLELNFLAFGSLIIEMPQILVSAPEFEKEFEGYIDSCLLTFEGDKSFILHAVYEFLDSNMTILSQMQSSYVMESLRSERIVYEWIDIYRGMRIWSFVGTESDGNFEYKEKYFAHARILLKDLIELTTSEKGHFMLVPEPLRDKMAAACVNIFRDRNLLKKSEVEEIYLSAQNVGIAFLQDLKKGVPIDRKVILRFRLLIKICTYFTSIWRNIYQSDNPEEDLIKKIYGSKLTEEFIVAYEENPSFLQKAGDIDVIETVLEFIVLIASLLNADANFISEERNSNFLKLVLQDSCEIDLRLVSKQSYCNFLLGLELLFIQAEFVKHLKEEKLLFGILRVHLLGPCASKWEECELPKNFCKIFSGDLLQKKTFLHLFGKFLEVFENKMRNPSLDFETALREFENGIEDEKKKYEQGEVGEEKTSQPYLAKREVSIINKRTIIKPLKTSAGTFCNKLSNFVERMRSAFKTRQPYLANRERTSINSLKAFAGTFCNKLSNFVEKMLSEFMSDLEYLSEQVEPIIRRFAKMSVDPLIAFTCNGSLLIKLIRSFMVISNADQGAFLGILEGVFAGIVDICREFKFTEYSVISKLDAKRLSKMVTKLATIKSLRIDDIPGDISYQEAALMSLLIGVWVFNSSLSVISVSPLTKMERLETAFKEATILIDQVQNNIHKCISLEIFERNNQDIEAFAEHCKIILEKSSFLLFFRYEVFKIFYGTEKLKAPTEEIYKTIIQRFDSSSLNDQDENSVLAGILENSFWLNEVYVGPGLIPENLWLTLITSPEVLEVLLKLEIYLLECADRYSGAKTKGLVQPMISSLEDCFSGGMMILNNEDEIRKNCFEKEEGKVLFRIIEGFLKKLATRQVPQRNCKILMKDNLNAVFGFFENFYKIYSNYTKEKVIAIDTKIEDLKKNTEDEVMELEKLEEEKVALIESYKNEIQKYINAIVQCQQHHMVNLKELFVLGEECGRVIPRSYWIRLFEQAHEDLSLYMGSNQIKLKDVSNYKSINQIYHMSFLYQCLEQFSIKEIVNELSLDKDLIEGLLMATKETLNSFISEDLMGFAQERECLDFTDTVNSFISRVSKIAINYIISRVLENNCPLAGDDLILTISLDLTESVLASQKCILRDMRQDIFSGSNKTCLKDTICLMNTILRANKSLGVEFINRGLLQKLLTVDKLSVMDSDEISSVLFLMMTLLEDSGKSHSENVLQKNLSPVAEKCIQILLKSLIENFAFEKTSMASLEKVKEKEKLENREDINNRRRRIKGYIFASQRPREEEWSSEPNLYWDESFNRQMIVKDTSALVVVLSGVLSNNPHLLPFVIFQETSVEEIWRQDPENLSFFKSNSRYSIFDILLRLVLLKDGSSAVFMIASLLEDNVIKTIKEQQSMELKYMLLIKIFEILADILDCEENQGQAHQSLNSVLMRRNIAIILVFISSKVNEDDSFSHKEEILQLIMQITQKLLSNPKMIAYSLQNTQPNKSMIQILSNIVKENISKLMTKEEIKSNYTEVLKVLKARDSYEPKVFHVDLKQAFDKNLFMMKKSRNKVFLKDQKKFESWEEKSQWEKEETKRLFEIAGLKEKELLSGVRFAAYGDTTLGADLTLNSIFTENAELKDLENLYKPVSLEVI